MTVRPAIDRFMEKVQVVESGCWEWQARIKNSGYGEFDKGYAHRFSHEAFKGPIPTGLHIDHLCRNPPCVNPAHLQAVTPRVNTLRGTSPGANAVRTNFCMHGHEFTPENTYYRPDGTGRACRACGRNRDRRICPICGEERSTMARHMRLVHCGAGRD